MLSQANDDTLALVVNESVFLENPDQALPKLKSTCFQYLEETCIFCDETHWKL